MQITLDHTEILKALDNYVRTLIDIKPNQSIAVAMKAGRLENGFSATLDIVTTGSTEEPMAAAPVAMPVATAPAAEAAAASIAKATPFPNRRAAAPVAVAAESEPMTDEGPEDTGPIEVNDLEDEPGSEETQPEPVVEAAPTKRSIFSKAS